MDLEEFVRRGQAAQAAADAAIAHAGVRPYVAKFSDGAVKRRLCTGAQRYTHGYRVRWTDAGGVDRRRYGFTSSERTARLGGAHGSLERAAVVDVVAVEIVR